MRVRQIETLLDLLETFARDKSPMTLSVMARALGIPKSSAFNIIDTLKARGLLYETTPRGGYYPTSRLFSLARTIMEGDALLAGIHVELAALARSTGETAVLAVRDRAEVVYLDVVESSAPIRYFARIGDRRPLYTTSSGKAVLTTLPAEERRQILHSLTYLRHQDTTASGPEDLEARLEESIARGWCEDRAEFTPDVMGLGIPLVLGESRFGIAVAGPLYRMQARREELVSMLKSAGARICGIGSADGGRGAGDDRPA